MRFQSQGCVNPKNRFAECAVCYLCFQDFERSTKNHPYCHRCLVNFCAQTLRWQKSFLKTDALHNPKFLRCHLQTLLYRVFGPMEKLKEAHYFLKMNMNQRRKGPRCMLSSLLDVKLKKIRAEQSCLQILIPEQAAIHFLKCWYIFARQNILNLLNHFPDYIIQRIRLSRLACPQIALLK